MNYTGARIQLADSTPRNKRTKTKRPPECSDL
jgi:hypothetical protein